MVNGSLAVWALLACALTSEALPQDAEVRTFLKQHCVECHGAEKPEGEFRIDTLAFDFSEQANRDRWLSVLKRIQAGEMPPEEKPRPVAKDSAALVSWVLVHEEAAVRAQRAAEGRVVLRRLNRAEYTNTVRDLLGIDLDLRENLALDGSVDGFDNVGSALHLSSFALERYMETAEAALNSAIADRPAPAKSKTRYSLKNQHAVKTYGNEFYRVLDDDTVVMFISTHDTTVWLSQFFARNGGNYRFRISASGFQSSGKPLTFGVNSSTVGLVGYFDVPADKPTVIEFVTRVKEQEGSIEIAPYGLGRAVTQTPGKAATYKGAGLAIHWVEVEGPLYDAWPPASHRRIFGDREQAPLPNSDRLEVISKNPEADAESIVGEFARRAFRRPVTEDELKPFLALVRARLQEKDSFEQAVRVGLVAVMSSPGFLFLKEKPGKLDDFALASRLSYFLWSTMPDEELLNLAAQKKLSDPETLRRQADRMLNDAKAAAFATNFCGQWLSLREIDFTEPHNGRYPEWDQMLKVSMVRETELFFSEILKHDLSLTNFIASDFAMLNGRMAKHYGIPDVEGLWEFHKVSLPADCHRGGVLTMGSVLKVTADGTNTSPVKRGSWVLERILGTPPPRPPADVPPLEPDIRGAKTLREQLAKHRDNIQCGACHASIDPPGFALESFDVIGGWREYYRVSNWTADVKEVPGQLYLQGHDVDATGETADGQKFQDIDEFKQLLLKDKDQIARALCERLVTYATGGAPEPADTSEIEAIVATARAKNDGLRTLVHEIIQSKMFQNK